MVKSLMWKLNAMNSDKWPINTKAYFFKNVGNLIASGFSLDHALEFTVETEPKLAKAVSQIANDLSNGMQFALSVRPFIDVETYQQLMVAERHGQLSVTLTELGRFFEARQRQMKKIQEILLYPFFLLGMLTLLVVGIKVVIMPSVSEIATTNTSVDSHNLFTWCVIFMFLIILGTAAYEVKQKTKIQKMAILIRFPLVGQVMQSYINYYLAGNLAVMLRNGLPSKEIIELLNTFERNSLLHNLGTSLNRELVDGVDIKIVVSKYAFISKEMINFFNTGLTTPQIAQSMNAYSQKHFEEFSRRVDRLINLVQPVMFCAIGVAIVLAYYQLLMPIYGSLKEIY
ncbi:type II secretion system F family protein [Lentilactobacillus sp. SPB1-3]|uniref:Type II secretion system F family protein n=1 Tax=Lentilactobacillus terminaliae TaxID=3003483 RepID=A0ACD5DDH5_9LACO|nr:type II secretion system F family protein [Lentilactobacillus sp. SPB1-3]MCZ0977343.1 type II secretion system F family protein [Lentilactobacillus sp. SPB1-3]